MTGPKSNLNDVNKVSTAKEFATFSMELTDEEITNALQIVVALQRKYATRPNTAANLEQLRDEALTKLSGLGILASLDPSPCFYGEPPNLEIIGKIPNGDMPEPMDHEKKRYEVLKANARGEDWLGQKEPVNSRKKKK